MEECLVCAFPFEPTERIHAFGVCGHNDICSICMFRIRSLQRNFSCPTCKTTLEYSIACDRPGATYSDFEIWNENIGPEFVFDQKSMMFFPKQYYYKMIEGLRSCICKICKQIKKDVKALRTHLTSDHNIQMCLLCIENKQSFPAEQKTYTQLEYEKHLRQGDNDGSDGHPLCEFCKKRYYDKTALFSHLIRDHFSCHLCEREGIQFQYFSTYNSLEKHFRTDHHLCEDPDCLARKFVAFSSPLDLTAHNLQWHPHLQVSRHIPVSFKYRRNDSSGSGDVEEGPGSEERERGRESRSMRFEGGAGGVAQGGRWRVEFPVSFDPRRRPDRDQRQVDEIDSNVLNVSTFTSLQHSPEAFPTLAVGGGGGGGAGESSKSWSNGSNISFDRKKKEDFPSLPAPSATVSISSHSGKWSSPRASSPPSIPLTISSKSKKNKSGAGLGPGAGISLLKQPPRREKETLPPPPSTTSLPPSPPPPSPSSEPLSDLSLALQLALQQTGEGEVTKSKKGKGKEKESRESSSSPPPSSNWTHIEGSPRPPAPSPPPTSSNPDFPSLTPSTDSSPSLPSSSSSSSSSTSSTKKPNFDLSMKKALGAKGPSLSKPSKTLSSDLASILSSVSIKSSSGSNKSSKKK